MDAREEVVCCPTCGLVQEAEEVEAPLVVECVRCGSTIRERKTESLVPTVALALAALILYVPANVYPILRLERYGLYTESTVWQGVAQLAQLGYWFVAAIVFSASIAVPLIKLAGLFYLAISAQLRTRRARRFRTRLYRLIDVVGPWAMLDVFLLAVLVALVRLGQLATVLPGRGLFAFTGVVVLTIVATALFDPRL
ncbi:MAG TPA: paraquat-inducible protein A, partial [Burkholderiales bacterium]|nr:paraquat-inducible protein A [Burkholderiales bacterium]